MSIRDIFRPRGDDDGLGSVSVYSPSEKYTEDSFLNQVESNGKEINDDDRSPIRKWVVGGAALGLTALLLAGIEHTKYNTSVGLSNHTLTGSVSDIFLDPVYGEYTQYVGSVYTNPAKLISDARNTAMTVNGGNLFEPDDIEETIKNISEQFDKQQKKIFKAGVVLDTSYSNSQNRALLEDICAAKEGIKKLYKNYEPLFVGYSNEIIAGAKGDKEYLGKMAEGGIKEYSIAIGNLESDIEFLNNCFETLDHPVELFVNPADPEGTVETTYLVDLSTLGIDFQAGEINRTEVADVEYYPIISEEKKDDYAGNFEISEVEVKKTVARQKGIPAVCNALNEFISGNVVGDLSIYGHTIHEDPDIF